VTRQRAASSRPAHAFRPQYESRQTFFKLSLTNDSRDLSRISLLYPRCMGGGLSNTASRPSVSWRSWPRRAATLGYRQACCLQLCHVRTADPSADGRRSAASRTAIGRGISSPPPGTITCTACVDVQRCSRCRSVVAQTTTATRARIGDAISFRRDVISSEVARSTDGFHRLLHRSTHCTDAGFPWQPT